jgi:rhamnulose-1-phosphate aldolase
MNFIDLSFAQNFIRMTFDAYQKGWHERNGGNLSYRLTEDDAARARPFLQKDAPEHEIGTAVPELAGDYFLLTGSGKFMRNIILEPENNIALIVISDDGKRYAIFWGLKNGGRPTSELPTHLINHAIKKRVSGGRNRVIYHAHPANIVALSFVLPLTDKAFTTELWEMISECPMVFPEGVGVVPWMVPGRADIGIATGKKMERYNIAVWAHHGVFCSGADFDEAFGLMDTVEKAAEIAVKVRSMGGKKQKISRDNFIALAEEFNVTLPAEFLE